MTLDEARERIGSGVVYRPGYEGAPAEDGTITSVSDRYVFVLYVGNRGSQATPAEQLTFLSGRETK